MIAFTTFEDADRVDALSAYWHVEDMLAQGHTRENALKQGITNAEDYWADRLDGVREQDGLFLLPDHPYHRQAAQELGINFEEI
jgi:hypothetical protein